MCYELGLNLRCIWLNLQHKYVSNLLLCTAVEACAHENKSAMPASNEALDLT